MSIANYQFYQMKLPSDLLKEFNWKFDTTFNKAKEDGYIVGVSDNQLFRTVRDIRNKNIDPTQMENLFKKKKELKKDGKLNTKEYKNIQYEINKYLYMSDIITVYIKHSAHYKYLYQNGFYILDKFFGNEPQKFVRLSCSAGQARKSTVVFCNSNIIDKVQERLNNNRDLTKPIAANKLNAYFGLYTSGTRLVTEPRFAVVPDYTNSINFKANWSTETDWDIDDIIEEKNIDLDMTRTDGMGLISPFFAKKWSEDLGLDYNCCNFIIRQSFIKGLLTTFDFVQYCKEKNNGNYLIKTVYKNELGEYEYVDVRDIDVIISEGQFKLWNSYKSQKQYVESYHKNKLYWGVSQLSKKEQDDILTLNYQFIQTLNMNSEGIKSICSQFLDWYNSISYEDANKALLFLLGINNSANKIKEYLNTSRDNWIRSLICNHDIIKDKYIQNKIYYYIKNKIKKAFLGEIFVNGNFQFLITDPYAYMQHLCEQEVTGLLGKNIYYSNYWNSKGIDKVDAMRSPMTYRSEHVILNLIKNEETEKWYKYIDNGIIINWFGNDCVRFSGSDFDGDLVATTSNEIMINSVYTDEYPVAYEAPKPQKIIPTYNDLCNADLFTFGSKIGQITNKGTTGYAILPLIEEKYGKNSDEYNLVISRLKQGCVAQSKQIDKAKLGKEVKSIPKAWTDKLTISADDSDETVKYKTLMNNCLFTKRPYFFRYKYNETDKEFKEYYNRNQKLSQMQWKLTLEELIDKKDKTKEQQLFVENYNFYCPVIDSNSTMNYLCKYLENTISLAKKINKDIVFNGEVYKNKNVEYSEKEYKTITNLFEKYKKRLNIILKNKCFDCDFDDDSEYSSNNLCFLDTISNSNISIDKIVNILIDYHYVENQSSSKDILWNEFGQYIYENLLNDNIKFPIYDKDGDIEYLGKRYSECEVFH